MTADNRRSDAAPGSRTGPADVSVVIATRDRPEMLMRAVRSVLAQTIPAAEIIVVDDASRQDVRDTLAALDDPRIQCLRHACNRGGSAARNTGLARATGRYVAFLDDDDTWSPEKTERLLAVFSAGDARIGGAFCYSQKLSAHDRAWSQVAKTPALRLGFEDFLRKTYFGASVPLLRTECVRKAGGFDENLRSVQDRDLWLRISRRHDFVGVAEVLVQNHIHGRQISSDLACKIDGREQLLEKFAPELEARPAILALHLWRLGLLYCAAGKLEQGRGLLDRAVRSDPANPGPAEDLEWSRRLPPQHVRRLVAERFNRVGDVVLYY